MNSAIKLVLASSLVFATWTLVTCPCETACECKLGVFSASAGIPLAYVLWENYARIAVKLR
jgi:hypothetical protein